jgi:hypothetical protein
MATPFGHGAVTARVNKWSAIAPKLAVIALRTQRPEIVGACTRAAYLIGDHAGLANRMLRARNEAPIWTRMETWGGPGSNLTNPWKTIDNKSYLDQTMR